MDKLIYLDNAATTKTSPEVVEAMLPYFTEHYGNPSSIYSFAAANKEVISKQRETIAGVIGAKENEIYFTAGGTEADNWALTATAEAYGAKGKHIITTKIEHHAVLHTCEYLQKRGYEVTYLDVDEYGVVDPKSVEAAIRPDTILISVMFANNEIGTVEPIKEIGAIAHEKGILFHTDAVQAFCQIPIDVDECHIDMLSASGHKLNGPKGIGFLYIRKGVKIRSLIHGGAQERRRRAGTENVPGIVGFGKAVEIAAASMERRMEKESQLRDYLIEKIEKEIPYCRLNGDRERRLPNNVNFSFQYIEGESLLIMLDMKGICASSGSACTSGSLDPSHVLLAIGLPHEIAHGSLRLTLGDDTTKEDLDYVTTCLKEITDVEKVLGRQIKYNTRIAEEGLRNPWGAQVGRVVLEEFGEDVKWRAVAKASAGSDARMSGCALPVIINSGSGNQGMTCSLPVIEFGKELKKSKEEIYRALCVSNLVALNQKKYIGSLSAYCGAVCAAAGAGAGITYLCGGTLEQIENTVVNTIADAGGIVCDGAKPSCAAKISTALQAAILSHKMAMRGLTFARGEGLVMDCPEDTIKAVGYVGRAGMKQTDVEILNLMIGKTKLEDIDK